MKTSRCIGNGRDNESGEREDKVTIGQGYLFFV